MRRNIRNYLEEHAALAPLALVLVAVLQRDPDAASASDGGASTSTSSSGSPEPHTSSSRTSGSPDGSSSSSDSPPPGREAQASTSSRGGAADARPAEAGEVLVGSAEVSFHPSTRSSYLTLNPADDCAYLCNMAVAGPARRQGIALHLVRAAEEISRTAGRTELCLHLRFIDEPAARLYHKAGFAPVDQDGWWVLLLGKQQRYLMQKQL